MGTHKNSTDFFVKFYGYFSKLPNESTERDLVLALVKVFENNSNG
jgi:hypothetical protein